MSSAVTTSAGPILGQGGGMHGAAARGLLDAVGLALGQEADDGDGHGGGDNPLLIRRGVPSDLQVQALRLCDGELGGYFLKAFSILDSTESISVELVLDMKTKPRALEQLKLILEKHDSGFRDMNLPWLVSLAGNGRGKLVPRNAFKQENYNSGEFHCYKLPEHHLPLGMTLVGVSVSGESDENAALGSWIRSLNNIKLKDVIGRCPASCQSNPFPDNKLGANNSADPPREYLY
ncbi:hypothetical protein ZWY2020_028789 [Hordeum vulgare]|nr:hypothetical protein ZWY2020_028789 [Hordeum vulgare]